MSLSGGMMASCTATWLRDYRMIPMNVFGIRGQDWTAHIPVVILSISRIANVMKCIAAKKRWAQKKRIADINHPLARGC